MTPPRRRRDEGRLARHERVRADIILRQDQLGVVAVGEEVAFAAARGHLRRDAFAKARIYL